MDPKLILKMKKVALKFAFILITLILSCLRLHFQEKAEAATESLLSEKLFLKISLYLQENTSVEVSF